MGVEEKFADAFEVIEHEKDLQLGIGYNKDTDRVKVKLVNSGQNFKIQWEIELEKFFETVLPTLLRRFNSPVLSILDCSYRIAQSLEEGTYKFRAENCLVKEKGAYYYSVCGDEKNDSIIYTDDAVKCLLNKEFAVAFSSSQQCLFTVRTEEGDKPKHLSLEVVLYVKRGVMLTYGYFPQCVFDSESVEVIKEKVKG